VFFFCQSATFVKVNMLRCLTSAYFLVERLALMIRSWGQSWKFPVVFKAPRKKMALIHFSYLLLTQHLFWIFFPEHAYFKKLKAMVEQNIILMRTSGTTLLYFIATRSACNEYWFFFLMYFLESKMTLKLKVYFYFPGHPFPIFLHLDLFWSFSYLISKARPR